MLPVYYPTKEEKADARLYAENIRKKMADTLGRGTKCPSCLAAAQPYTSIIIIINPIHLNPVLWFSDIGDQSVQECRKSPL